MSATLEIKVIPNASRNEIVGMQDGALKIKIQTPAEDGKANAALIAFLAKQTGCKKGQIRIQSGEKSRQKILCFEKLQPEELQQWLSSLTSPA